MQGRELFKNRRKYKGEEVEKREKWKFSFYLEEIISFKKGGGQKYPILGKYTHLQQSKIYIFAPFPVQT